MSEWCWKSAGEIARAVRSKEASAVEILRAHLERIGAVDGKLRCFLRVDENGAMEQARAVDRAIADGNDPGPLAGVPIGLKDLFVTRGVETTAGSRALAGWVP